MSKKRYAAVLGTLAATSLMMAPLASAATALPPATEAAVDNALHQEAFDWTSYALFGEQAQREGKSSAATAFKNAASTERNKHLVALAEVYGLVGSTAANLQKAIDGETYEATVMYPEFAATARAEGCNEIAIRFDRIAAEEWMHARKYQAALQAVNTGTGSIPQAASLNWVTVTPTTAACGPKTQANLQAAMRGESLATAKYQLFAAQARSVGQSRVANLFDGTSAVEFREHMSREAMYAGLVGSTATNLSTAAAREDYQGTVTYPQAAATATSEGATAAASLFTSMATDELALRDSFLAVR